MSTRISYKTMTDAELIDEGLDCDPSSLAYELAVTLDALPINHGSVQIDDEPCGRCSDLDDEILSLETQVYSLETKIESLDMDRLVAGVRRAKEAVKQASDKVNYLLGPGGDDE